MNSKLMKASIAGAAVAALAAGGSTFAAYSDFGNVNGNSIGAGILKLDLANGDTSAVQSLAFGNLAPGMGSNRATYVASSDGASVPNADLYLTIGNVQNQDNGCSSASESVADATCGDAGDPGELSRVLNVRVESYKPPTTGTCETEANAGIPAADVVNAAVIQNEVGSLADPANISHQFLISDAAHPLAKGQGLCVAFFTYWPKTQDPAHSYSGLTLPADNAAQGDSMTFDAHYDLVQH